MPAECAICLNGYKEPSSLPCGHIFCLACIVNVVNTVSCGAKALCPTCRAGFSVTTPDLRFLPKKYHEFMLPSLRRVFPSDAAEVSLKQKLSSAKSELEVAGKERSHYRHLYERANQRYRNEKVSLLNANTRIEALREEIITVGCSSRKWMQEHNDVQQQHKLLKSKYSHLSGKHENLLVEHKRLVESEATQSRRRKELGTSYSQLSVVNSRLTRDIEGLTNSHNDLKRKYQAVEEELARYKSQNAPEKRITTLPSLLVRVPRKSSSSSKAKTIANPSTMRTRSATKQEEQSGTPPSISPQVSVERANKRPRLST